MGMSLITAVSAATYLESLVTERHIDEAGISIEAVVAQYLLDTGCCLGVLGHHVQIATTTR